MAKRVSVQDKFKAIRQRRTDASGAWITETLQGISKTHVGRILSKLDRSSRDTVDCVFALLDDTTESFKGFTFSDGASTAQLGSHIAFLQRDDAIKLDREGRDYWIKPLIEIGAIERVTLLGGKFVSGHVIAKSGNSAYRLDPDFVEILRAPEGQWEMRLAEWNSKDTTRRRLEMQADAAEHSKKAINSGHKQLIRQSIDVYAKKFLSGYEVLYVDDSDGERISPEERDRLMVAGIKIGPEDAFPDLLLWNPSTDFIWCIEAVTSDGEVDHHKVEQVQKLVERSGKSGVGFTTTYQTWKAAASRQDANKNLAVGTYLWIASDPSRQFEVQSFESEMREHVRRK